MRYFKKLVGERIYLSPMNLEDVELYTKWMNDFEVTNGIGASARMISISSERNWIQQNTQDQYQFSIVRLEDDKLIGSCCIEQIDQIHQRAVAGLMIGDEKNRGQGYGTETLKLLLKYSFDYLNLHNVMLGVFSFNQRAIACYQKVGFREVGRRRECYYVEGRFYDEIYMDILKSEWKDSTK